MALKEFAVYLFFCSVWLNTAYASTEYNRYVTQIFQKYGSGDTINFEGLEHLMYSLGLGHIQFESTHTIDEHRPQGYEYAMETKVDVQPSTNESQTDIQLTDQHSKKNQTQASNVTKILEFREMHDPKHRHPRESTVALDGQRLPAAACLSPKSLLALIVDHDDLHRNSIYNRIVKNEKHNSEEEYNEFINSVLITPNAFLKLCPALLSQIDNGVCMQPAKRQAHNDQEKKDKIWRAWIYASISMFVLSACGLLGILLVPLMKTVAYQEILKFLVAIAVGTLAGDALMHLLPHALFKEEKHEHAVDTLRLTAQDESHKHSSEAALLCGCSFLAALFMFMLENLIPLLKGDQQGHGHGHSHTHGHSHSHAEKPQAPAQEAPAPRELNVMLNETKLDKKAPSAPLTPIAFMVIIGDGLHNLTDGLAIGAAFASDPVTGLATAFAVLCHELPHELGDFALLLQTGVSIRRAVYMNIVSSVLSFVGMSIGLLLVGIGDGVTQWIYAATAGSFLYIAFADLVPTMSVAHNPELARDPKGIIIQILGIFLGGAIMLVIALNEHDLEGLFKGE
ncbi:zinc transporter foi [Drosophila albomicans]|uniref:Zinc transporter foi n=1 Tax=Drosophila albomicans TaxID=7291 RepID=A0A6P8WUS4_DROAB|nr:zinc transporter foi [Drosophila albomicans]